MKRYLIAIIILGIASSMTAQDLQFDWACSFGGLFQDKPNTIAVDNSDNIITAGYFNGTVDFDPGDGVYNLTSFSEYSNSFFISKLDENGNFLWAIAAEGTGGSSVNSVAVDDIGNIYVTGDFNGTVDFDPGSGVYNLSTGSETDFFVCKYHQDGSLNWVKGFGSYHSDRGNSITVDENGNVYTTGYFKMTVDFDPGSGVHNITSNGFSEDIFISKLDTNGDFVFAKSLGGPYDDNGASIVIDESGNIITTGRFYYYGDFDPGNGVFNLNSHGHNDIFVSKLDASGDFVWAKNMGGSSSESGNAVTFDPSGYIYTIGNFTGTVDFDPSAQEYLLTSEGGNDIFISKLNNNGDFVWAKSWGGSDSDFGMNITVDDDGFIISTGNFKETVDFDPGESVYNLNSNGGSDVFINKLDSEGSFVMAISMGGTYNYDIGVSITNISNNAILCTGAFGGTADFDPGSNVFNLTSNGSNDVFISKFMSGQPLSANFTANHTFIFFGDQIQFTDLSTENPTSWEWDFNSDGSIDSYEQHPIFIPSLPGFYTVTLTASNGVSTDTETKIDYIFVEEIMVPAIADFYAEPTSVSAGESVSFYDLSMEDPIEWHWDFQNDGTIDSYEQNPQWTYENAGIYSVSLTVDNGYGSDTETKTDYIAVVRQHNISLSEGWSGLSSYLNPVDGNLEELLAPVIDNLIIVQNPEGFYWPDGSVNTLGNFDIEKGYQIKVINACELNLEGLPSEDHTIQLSQGWNLIPVLSESEVDIAALFEDHMDKLLIIKESVGTGIYWPEKGITGIEKLQPANSYFVKVSEGFTIDFDVQPGFSCGDILIDERDGQEYETVQIGDQCWMAENLNVGTRIDGTGDMTDNGTIEKYCYDNEEGNCDVYGGLYQWNEAMQYVTTEGTQGICPDGWHFPSDEEWKKLEGEVDSQYGYPDPEWDRIEWRGFDVGLNLKSTTGWNYGGSGTDLFEYGALPGGYWWNTSGSFHNIGDIAYWWSSSEYLTSYTWGHRLNYDDNRSDRYSWNKSKGFSVRCLKD